MGSFIVCVALIDIKTIVELKYLHKNSYQLVFSGFSDPQIPFLSYNIGKG